MIWGALLIVIAGAVAARYSSRRGRVVLLAAYFLTLIYLTFLTREPAPIYHYRISLFGAARRGLEFGGGVVSGLLNGDVRVSNWSSLEGIILNILLFVPFGYLVPSLFPRLRHVVLLAFCVSLIIEVLQLVTRLGYADVDDLINNTIGAAIGTLIYNTLLKKVDT